MTERKSFLLRVDPRLFAALEGWAADELRSINGQIEFLLQQAVKKAGRWSGKGDRADGAAAEARDKARPAE